jgi:uncharacterized delta-60 repeat protein
MGRRGGSIKAAARRAPLAALAVLAIAAPNAVAKPGVLDRGFGDGGRAATALDLGSSWEDATIKMAIADASIVVSSERQLIRYLPSGQLDRGFGDNGILTLEQVEGLSFDLGDVAVDSEGRIVAFGTAVDQSKTFHLPGYIGATVNPTWAVVLRFDAAGRLDPSFGAGGIVRTDFGLPMGQAEGGAKPPLIQTVAGTVDSQDRPMLVAAQFEHIPTEGHSYLGWVSRIVARLTSSGQPDPGFGTGGGVTVLPSSGYEGLIAADAGEPLLLWSGAQAQPRPLSWVTRLRLDGQPDSAYRSGGISGGGGDVALDRFGRLLILERPDGKAARVLRLRPDGNLDPGFGRGGRATVALPARGSAVSSIDVDGRGRAVIVGASSRPRAGAQPKATALIIAARLRASGKVDPAFGNDGWAKTGFGRRTNVAGVQEVVSVNRWQVVGPQAALDSRGRLVVADTARSPQLQPGGIVLVRYRMN